MTLSRPTWKRLIRFTPPNSTAVLYGEPVVGDDSDVGRLADAGRLTARVVEPGPQGVLGEGTCVTDRTESVDKLLAPIGPADVIEFKCIGLNYRKHIIEAGRSLPPFPSLFIKPGTAHAEYGQPVPIPKCAQEGEADYEGELCVVIGRDAKDVSKEDALSYVAGYTAGDDVSTRKWQRLKERAGGVPQWCFSKGFDNFAPLGPVLVSPELIANPAALRLKTSVNGELRQDTSVADLVFDVPTIISFLSQGTTLRRGTVIMTGTPGGVGLPPDIQAYLEAVSRSQYGTWEPNGFSDGLKWFLFKDGPRRGPPSRRYHPDPDAIQRGMAILRAASTSAENQSANFFFPQGHEFSTEALREFPHYPWAADSPDAIDAVVATAHLPYLEDPHDGFAGDEFIILGNVRLALPPGLPGPENGDVWRQIVAESYGQGHPAMQRVCLEDWSEASLCAQQAEHLGCIQFSVNDR
ncbi:hypothetical protein CcaverHIS002_0312640 [Cutaneotrichosporon cavernicola]|nr:hypothetical protein CcaverHIS002_0312640 [Cutaneotrichosporon cavernicola]